MCAHAPALRELPVPCDAGTRRGSPGAALAEATPQTPGSTGRKFHQDHRIRSPPPPRPFPSDFVGGLQERALLRRPLGCFFGNFCAHFWGWTPFTRLHPTPENPCTPLGQPPRNPKRPDQPARPAKGLSNFLGLGTSAMWGAQAFTITFLAQDVNSRLTACFGFKHTSWNQEPDARVCSPVLALPCGRKR